jgi:aspartate/methionine/tyrosine aminotransferase
MRRDIVPVGADSLNYEIREIVGVANELKKMGVTLYHENIGDPIAKGEKVPAWIKQIVKDLVDNDLSWGYCDTQGVLATRQFLADKTNSEGGIQITANDIYFFNGLGDAIAKNFGFLKREARVIGPTPAYSSHSSAEAAHSGYEHLTYSLDPKNDWQPNVDEIYNKAKYNDSIAGILVLNPGNPTGAVVKKDILKRICEIAEELDLYVVCDEIYSEIVYDPAERVKLATVIGNACGISLNGISKQVPWPGSRCGWIEVYNKKKDKIFQKYIDTILKAKRLEVCSTTMPQMAVPLILGDPRYKEHTQHRIDKFKHRADEIEQIFAGMDGVHLIKPHGAFYVSVIFDDGVLNDKQTLPIENEEIRSFIESALSKKKFALDKRFVYYLLAATGIIAVPMTGFYSKYNGFRLTLLEENDEKRVWIFKTIRENIEKYIKS